MSRLQLNLQLQMTDNQSSPQIPKMFSLVRLKPECKVLPVRVDFSSHQHPNLPPTLIAPLFNHDHCYFTPSFLLPADKKFYQDNAAFQKSQFEEKIQRSARESAQLDCPLPPLEVTVATPNSEYCQICQDRFEDYFKHIQLKSHIQRSINNETNLLIHTIAQSFRDREAKAAKESKTKIIHKGKTRQIQKLGEKKSRNARPERLRLKDDSVKGQNHSTEIVENSLPIKK